MVIAPTLLLLLLQPKQELRMSRMLVHQPAMRMDVLVSLLGR